MLEEEWSFCSWILASGSLVRFWELPELVGKEQNQFRNWYPEIRRALLGYEKAESSSVELVFQSREKLIDWVMEGRAARLLIMNTIQKSCCNC